MPEEKKKGFLFILGEIEAFSAAPIEEKKYFFANFLKKWKRPKYLPFEQKQEEPFVHFFNILKLQFNHPIYFFDCQNRDSSLAEKMLKEQVDTWIVIPLLFHFSYQWTGAIAKYFYHSFPMPLVQKFLWIRSFSHHPLFQKTYCEMIKKTLQMHQIYQEETLFLFTARKPSAYWQHHMDIYSYECEEAMKKIIKQFPYAAGQLTYDLSMEASFWQTIAKKRKTILVLPFHSFYSSHKKKKTQPSLYYCPLEKMLNLWIEPLLEIVQSSYISNTLMLIPNPTHNMTYEKAGLRH